MDIYARHEARLRDAWRNQVEATDEDGNPVHDRVLPDGGKVRVPLPLMDSEAKTTLDACLAERDRVRAELDRKLFAADPRRGHLDLSSAPLPIGQRSLPVGDADRARSEQAYSAYCNALTSAWRDPPGGV